MSQKNKQTSNLHANAFYPLKTKSLHNWTLYFYQFNKNSSAQPASNIIIYLILSLKLLSNIYEQVLNFPAPLFYLEKKLLHKPGYLFYKFKTVFYTE